MIKRVINIVLCFLLILTINGCKDKKTSATNNLSHEPKETETTIHTCPPEEITKETYNETKPGEEETSGEHEVGVAQTTLPTVNWQDDPENGMGDGAEEQESTEQEDQSSEKENEKDTADNNSDDTDEQSGIIDLPEISGDDITD